jgi:hypothetical protein
VPDAERHNARLIEIGPLRAERLMPSFLIADGLHQRGDSAAFRDRLREMRERRLRLGERRLERVPPRVRIFGRRREPRLAP